MNEHVRGNGREGAKEGGRREYKAVIYETAPRYNERPRGQRTAKRRDTNLFWTHSEISRNKYEPGEIVAVIPMDPLMIPIRKSALS